MQTIGINITLRIPDHMTPEQAVGDVRTSIGFGQALDVNLAWVLPDPPTDEVTGE